MSKSMLVLAVIVGIFGFVALAAVCVDVGSHIHFTNKHGRIVGIMSERECPRGDGYICEVSSVLQLAQHNCDDELLVIIAD